jgi:hypothetical protein
VWTRLAALAALVSLTTNALAQDGPVGLATEVVAVTVRPQVTLRYLAIFKRDATPSAAVILFSGGDGFINLTADGSHGAKLNFLVRSRWRFARRDLFVAVVDTPNRMRLNGLIRTSARYAQDIGEVIADVRRRARGAPVWLIGTSAGTLSAAGVAGHLPLSSTAKVNDNRPNGIVLTATQSTLVAGLCGKTVFDAKLGAINVPAYLVAHRDDACPCSPASGAKRVSAALVALSPAQKQVRIFVGGAPPQTLKPCEAMTRHGFIGIEDAVVAAIADWIKTH